MFFLSIGSNSKLIFASSFEIDRPIITHKLSQFFRQAIFGSTYFGKVAKTSCTRCRLTKLKCPPQRLKESLSSKSFAFSFAIVAELIMTKPYDGVASHLIQAAYHLFTAPLLVYLEVYQNQMGGLREYQCLHLCRWWRACCPPKNSLRQRLCRYTMRNYTYIWKIIYVCVAI